MTPKAWGPGVNMQLIVGTHGFEGNVGLESPRTYRLQPGANTIFDPTGGVLWLRVVSRNAQAQGTEVSVEFRPNGAVRNMPVYRLGVSTFKEWIEQLTPWPGTLPVQMISDRVVITARRSSAMSVLQNPGALLAEYARMLDEQKAIAAIAPGTDSPLPILVSEKVGGNPNAGHYHISLPSYGRYFLTAGGVRTEWGVWHELGHMQQQIAWSTSSITENSVNIYALAVQRYLRQPSRAVPYDAQAHAYLNGPNQSFGKASHWVALVMWEQLRTAFGDRFFHRLHEESRKNGNSDTGQGNAQYTHYLMVASCKAARADLTTFFTRWGWQMASHTVEEIKSLGLKAPSPDPSTLHLKDQSYVTMAFKQDGYIHITGTAQRGSRIKTTNNPAKGWYDPEGGKVFADATTGVYGLRTKRSINGLAAVKSYDPDTGAAISESNHHPVADSYIDILNMEHSTPEYGH